MTPTLIHAESVDKENARDIIAYYAIVSSRIAHLVCVCALYLRFATCVKGLSLARNRYQCRRGHAVFWTPDTFFVLIIFTVGPVPQRVRKADVCFALRAKLAITIITPRGNGLSAQSCGG